MVASSCRSWGIVVAVLAVLGVAGCGSAVSGADGGSDAVSTSDVVASDTTTGCSGFGPTCLYGTSGGQCGDVGVMAASQMRGCGRVYGRGAT